MAFESNRYLRERVAHGQTETQGLLPHVVLGLLDATPSQDDIEEAWEHFEADWLELVDAIPGRAALRDEVFKNAASARDALGEALGADRLAEAPSENTSARSEEAKPTSAGRVGDEKEHATVMRRAQHSSKVPPRRPATKTTSAPTKAMPEAPTVARGALPSRSALGPPVSFPPTKPAVEPQVPPPVASNRATAAAVTPPPPPQRSSMSATQSSQRDAISVVRANTPPGGGSMSPGKKKVVMLVMFVATVWVIRTVFNYQDEMERRRSATRAAAVEAMQAQVRADEEAKLALRLENERLAALAEAEALAAENELKRQQELEAAKAKKERGRRASRRAEKRANEEENRRERAAQMAAMAAAAPNPARAAVYLEQAIALDPDNDDYRQRLDETNRRIGSEGETPTESE